MGYVARPTYRQIEWGTDLGEDSITLTTIAGDIGDFSGVLPTYSGNIILAYMDILIGQVQNSSAGANALDGAQYMRIKKSGGTYVNAFKFGDGQFTMSTGDKMECGRLYGNINIATTINTIGSGGSYNWQWHNAKSLANNIYIKGAFHPILRVIFQ